MSSSFEEPSEVTQRGYVWRDSRDTLPPSEYGKTCWTGQFPEGSVDADLKSFKLSRFNDEKFQFCLGSCPKGVRIHLQLNFTFCPVDGKTFKYQHWWVYGLTEAHPIGSLRYAIRNPNDWWLRCVSIESVERTVVGKGRFAALSFPRKQVAGRDMGGYAPRIRIEQQFVQESESSSSEESEDSDEEEIGETSKTRVTLLAGKSAVCANSAGSCVNTTGSNPTVSAATPSTVSFKTECSASDVSQTAKRQKIDHSAASGVGSDAQSFAPVAVEIPSSATAIVKDLPVDEVAKQISLANLLFMIDLADKLKSDRLMLECFMFVREQGGNEQMWSNLLSLSTQIPHVFVQICAYAGSKGEPKSPNIRFSERIANNK